jgi:hypothetical protein
VCIRGGEDDEQEQRPVQEPERQADRQEGGEGVKGEFAGRREANVREE